MADPDLKAAIAGDARAARRVAKRKQGPVAAQLAQIAVKTSSQEVANIAGGALSRRRKDRAAIPAMRKVLRATPQTDDILPCWEWVACALGDRKEPEALAAAISSYRAMPEGRSRYFLLQQLSNRTQREHKTLRENPAFVRMFMNVMVDSKDPEVRGVAIWGLCKLAHPRSLVLMLFMLADKDSYVADIAACTLVAIGGKRAIKAVRAYLNKCSDQELVADLTKQLGKRTS